MAVPSLATLPQELPVPALSQAATMPVCVQPQTSPPGRAAPRPACEATDGMLRLPRDPVPSSTERQRGVGQVQGKLGDFTGSEF